MRHPFHILPPHPSLRLRVLHERPYILSVPNLLSSDECRRLREKAEPHLRRQTFHNVSGRSRTSSGCVLRNDEVSTAHAQGCGRGLATPASCEREVHRSPKWILCERRSSSTSRFHSPAHRSLYSRVQTR